MGIKSCKANINQQSAAIYSRHRRRAAHTAQLGQSNLAIPRKNSITAHWCTAILKFWDALNVQRNRPADRWCNLSVLPAHVAQTQKSFSAADHCSHAEVNRANLTKSEAGVRRDVSGGEKREAYGMRSSLPAPSAFPLMRTSRCCADSPDLALLPGQLHASTPPVLYTSASSTVRLGSSASAMSSQSCSGDSQTSSAMRVALTATRRTWIL